MGDYVVIKGRFDLMGSSDYTEKIGVVTGRKRDHTVSQISGDSRRFVIATPFSNSLSTLSDGMLLERSRDEITPLTGEQYDKLMRMRSVAHAQGFYFPGDKVIITDGIAGGIRSITGKEAIIYNVYGSNNRSNYDIGNSVITESNRATSNTYKFGVTKFNTDGSFSGFSGYTLGANCFLPVDNANLKAKVREIMTISDKREEASATYTVTDTSDRLETCPACESTHTERSNREEWDMFCKDCDTFYDNNGDY